METVLFQPAGQWLLDLMRFAGVVVGVAGTAITAPKALREVRRIVADSFRRLWAQRPWHKKPPPHTGSGSGTFTFTTSASGSVGVVGVWPDDVEGRIESLRRQAERIEEDLSQFRVQHGSDIAEMRAETAALRTEHRATVEEWRAAQDSRDQLALRLNTRGVPLIAISIVLSGMPDAYVRWSSVLVVTLIVVATVVTFIVARSARQLGTAGP